VYNFLYIPFILQLCFSQHVHTYITGWLSWKVNAIERFFIDHNIVPALIWPTDFCGPEIVTRCHRKTSVLPLGDTTSLTGNDRHLRRFLGRWLMSQETSIWSLGDTIRSNKVAHNLKWKNMYSAQISHVRVGQELNGEIETNKRIFSLADTKVAGDRY
jgi:hypothetical protein